MKAYYNEIDPYAAQWLRNLIEAGHIAPGDVDERSIEDVTPKDLHGYTQCHFFAGIGVWSHALRKSGWTDDRPVWTGSCPCQPFSAAGKGGGFDDERHLWPAFHHLIRVCRPPIVIGEQVASKDGLSWLDLVSSDMEGEGYAFGAVDTCAAGVGAPHIRQRLYWVADAVRSGSLPGPHAGVHSRESGTGSRYGELERPGAACGLADAGHVEHRGRDTVRGADGEHGGTAGAGEGPGAERIGAVDDPSVRSTGCWLADAHREGRSGRGIRGPGEGDSASAGATLERPSGLRADGIGRPGPTNGLWADADWLGCRDGKWRPVEPGTFPLAHGATARVGRLRAYGNAIVAQQAQAFIEAVMNNG